MRHEVLDERDIVTLRDDVNDDGVAAIVRRHPRTIVVLGVGYIAAMKEREALLGLRRAGAILLSAEPRPQIESDVTHNHLLSQTVVSWLVPEICRVYLHTTDGRIAFARELLARTVSGRNWLAHALMVCPSRAEVACAALSVSVRTLDRQMQKDGASWCNATIEHYEAV